MMIGATRTKKKEGEQKYKEDKEAKKRRVRGEGRPGK